MGMTDRLHPFKNYEIREIADDQWDMPRFIDYTWWNISTDDWIAQTTITLCSHRWNGKGLGGCNCYVKLRLRVPKWNTMIALFYKSRQLELNTCFARGGHDMNEDFYQRKNRNQDMSRLIPSWGTSVISKSLFDGVGTLTRVSIMWKTSIYYEDIRTTWLYWMEPNKIH